VKRNKHIVPRQNELLKDAKPGKLLLEGLGVQGAPVVKDLVDRGHKGDRVLRGDLL
jgi:hypothetical protein